MGRDRGRAGNGGETFLVNENGHVSLPFLFFPLSLLGIHFLLPVARLPLFCSVANCSRHASFLSIFLLRPLYDRAIVSEAKVEEIRILCCQRVTPYISTLCAFKCAPVFLIVGPLHSLLPSLSVSGPFSFMSLPLLSPPFLLLLLSHVSLSLWPDPSYFWLLTFISGPPFGNGGPGGLPCAASHIARARDGTDGTPPAVDRMERA